MNRIIIFTFFIIFLLTSCQNSSSNSIQVYFDDGFEELPLDPMGINNFIRFQINDNKLTYYNHIHHQIEEYDWKSKKLLRKIKLQSFGPEGVGDVMSLFPKNNGHFILNDQNFAYEIDGSGKVLKKHSIFSKNNASQDLLPVKDFSIISPIGIGNQNFYNSEENALYQFLRRFDLPTTHPDYFNLGGCVSKLDMVTGQIELIHIPQPEEVQEFKAIASRYTNFFMPLITDLDDRLLVNFKVDSKAYLYDKKKGDLKTIPMPVTSCQNTSTLNGMSLKTPQLLDKLREQNPVFGPISYDPYRNIFIRMHYCPTIKDTGEVPTFLTIWDEQFKKLAEVPVKEKVHYAFQAVEEGILFKYNYELPSEDTAYFKLLLINDFNMKELQN